MNNLVHYFADMPNLAILGLQENGVTMNGLRTLCDSLPQTLTTIGLGGNAFGMEGEMHFLKATIERLPRLTDVWFGLFPILSCFGITQSDSIWIENKPRALAFIRSNHLQLACAMGDEEFVRSLVAKGADVNVANEVHFLVLEKAPPPS